jgi:hypothetical protein
MADLGHFELAVALILEAKFMEVNQLSISGVVAKE